MKFTIELNKKQSENLTKRAELFGDTPEKVVKMLIFPLIDADEVEFEEFLNMSQSLTADDLEDDFDDMPMIDDYGWDDNYDDDDDDFDDFGGGSGSKRRYH